MNSPIDHVLAHIRRIEAYTPGTQPSGSGWIKLNTNELPYAPPASVGNAIREELSRLPFYPNPKSIFLREAIAEKFKLGVEQVIIGNGSDDLLNLLMRAFGGDGHIVGQTEPSYSLYPVLSAIANGKLESIPFDDQFTLPVDKLISSHPDILFLTCPNAPTGIRFSLEQLKQLAAGISGILVIDEAYAEFAEANALPLLKLYTNVVITRTFSKAYGLAGLRVGYAMGSAETIGVLDRIRDSYNVNRLSQAGALAAIREEDYYESVINRLKTTRERFRTSLISKGWSVYPSESNFVFAKPASLVAGKAGERAASLFKHLESNQILVRYFPNHSLTAAYLRISIGTDDEMNRLSESIEKWEQNA